MVSHEVRPLIANCVDVNRLRDEVAVVLVAMILGTVGVEVATMFPEE